MHVHDGERNYSEILMTGRIKRACVSNIFEVSVSFYKSYVSDILIISLHTLSTSRVLRSTE